MDEQKKPIDTATAVFLVMISGISDIADLATDLIFLVPIIGQIVFLGNSMIISPIVWAIIQFSFIMKAGVGRAALIPVAGGLGNIANIPGSETITTVIAIFVANHQKLSQVAVVAGKKLSKRGAVAEKNAANAASKEGGVAAGAGVEGKEGEGAGATRTGTRSGARNEEIAEGETGKRARGDSQERDGSAGAATELGEAPGPFEELQRLTKETPGADNNTNKERGVQLDGNKVYL